MDYMQENAKCSEHIRIVISDIQGSYGGQCGDYCLLRCDAI